MGNEPSECKGGSIREESKQRENSNYREKGNLTPTLKSVGKHDGTDAGRCGIKGDGNKEEKGLPGNAGNRVARGVLLKNRKFNSLRGGTLLWGGVRNCGAGILKVPNMGKGGRWVPKTKKKKAARGRGESKTRSWRKKPHSTRKGGQVLETGKRDRRQDTAGKKKTGATLGRRRCPVGSSASKSAAHVNGTRDGRGRASKENLQEEGIGEREPDWPQHGSGEGSRERARH